MKLSYRHYIAYWNTSNGPRFISINFEFYKGKFFKSNWYGKEILEQIKIK